MAKEVNEILLSAQSVDVSVCKQAEERLKQLEEQDPCIYLLSLSAELANDKNPVGSRKLAGLLLKNAIYADLEERWVWLDDVVKTQIEGNLSRTLKSRVYEARFTALQVIAKVVGMELEQEQWLELIGELSGSSSHQVKQASLETLGYLCEEVSSCADLGGDEVHKKILKAIVQGMNASEASNDVRLAATRALYSVLDFAVECFTTDTMEAICEAAVSTDVKIRQAAFECLVCISLSNYEELGSNNVEKLLNVTREALKADEEPVALQAIRFWSLICDKEIYRLENFMTNPCFNYIQQALPGLVPMLLETLLNQDDGAANVATAGRGCLALVARIVGGGDIVPLVRPFIEENIKKPDWRQREAATYVFGSILEFGPSHDKAVPLHVEVVTLSFMLKTLTNDPNNHLRETTAWTLGRIFVHLYDLISVTPADCQGIITVLLSSMKKDAPNVAEKACWALCNLVEFVIYVYQSKGLSLTKSSLEEIVQQLLTVTQREDAGESRLRSAACETLMKAVWCFPEEEVIQLLLIIQKELQETLVEQKELNERQELLCWCLDHIFRTLMFSSFLMQHADEYMKLFFQVLACPSATGHEEAMRAVGTLSYTLMTDFATYMPDFSKFLEQKLRNRERGYAVAVEVVGRIFKALRDKGLTWSDSLMQALVEHYEHVDPSVKPLVLSCFGDIAHGIGHHFNKYFEQVFPLLLSGSGGDEMMEHALTLKIAANKAYTYIFQVLNESPECPKNLLPFL